jgi:RND family efflux transporter MFP subunit
VALFSNRFIYIRLFVLLGAKEFALKTLRLVFAILFLFSCQACLKEDKKNPVKKETIVEHSPPEVMVGPVQKGPIHKTYTSVGTVTPKDSSRIFPKVSGRISEVLVEEGDIITKGQRLMQIDTFDYVRLVENATAVRSQAKSNLAKTIRDHERIKKLYADKAVPKQNLQDMETAMDLARFGYDQAATALKKAGDDLKECGVSAPISGMITMKMVNPGELTGPQVMAFMIMQMGTVEVEVDLPEEAFGYVAIGKKGFVSFDAVPDKTIEGKITMIHPTIDPVSRTVKVTLSIDNPDLAIRSGMTARTRIVEMARENVLYAPKNALIPMEDQYVVYKVDSGKATKTTVVVGIIGDDVFEVKEGLTVEDRLVVRGITGLRNGMKVKVVPFSQEKG